jgi:hypothetical protein
MAAFLVTIQALDRLDPVLPLSPGRAERHGFENANCFKLPRGARHNCRDDSNRV